LSTNKTVQAMEIGATLRKERYEEILEELYWVMSDRLADNPEFKTKEIIELVQTVQEMLQIVPNDSHGIKDVLPSEL